MPINTNSLVLHPCLLHWSKGKCRIVPSPPAKKHFPWFTWQSWQQSPCAHTAPGFKAQVVALQHRFVHSCRNLGGKFRADNVQSQWALNQEAAYSSAKKSWAWNHELCMKFDNLIQTALSALRFNKPNKCSEAREAAEEGWFIPAMDLIPNVTNNPSTLTSILMEPWGVLFPQESVEWFHCLQRGSRSCSALAEHHNYSSILWLLLARLLLGWRLGLTQRRTTTGFHVIPYQSTAVTELWDMEWTRFAASLTDTSQFHTCGLDGAVCGLLQTLLSVERACKEPQKRMDLFFQDNAHKLQVTPAELESHLSHRNSSR